MIRKKEYLFYLLIYMVSLFFLLTTQGMFWDDWVVFHVVPEARLNLYTMSGRPLYGHFFNLLFSLDHDGFVIFRALIFLSFLFPIFIVDKLLSKIKEIPDYTRFFLVCFFALFPVNSSRIAITMAQYSFCYFLFFLAFWFTSLYLETRKIYWRILALGIFYLSFTMDSLQVFFAIVLLYILYQETLAIESFKEKFSLKNVKKIVLKYVDFLILPVLYFIMRKLLFTPYGLYTNYNEVSLSKLASAAVRILYYVKITLVPVAKQSLKLVGQYPVIILVSTAIIYFILKKFVPKEDKKENFKTQLVFLGLGVVFTALAIFPYFVVDAAPGLYNWSSRHQILMTLGGSFITYFGFDVVFSLIQQLYLKIKKRDLPISTTLRTIFYSFVITVFTATILVVHLQYQKDWFKQLSLIENMKNNEVVKTHTSFQFVDNTLDLNATLRTYNFYEFTGLMKYTFGDETRYGSLDEKYDVSMGSAIPYPQYNVGQHIPKPYEYKIKINFGSYALTDKSAIKLVFYRMFNKEKFNKAISNIISLEAESV